MKYVLSISRNIHMQTFKMWILFCVPVNSAKYIFLAVESLYLMFCALYVLTCSQAHFPVKVKQTSGQMCRTAAPWFGPQPCVSYSLYLQPSSYHLLHREVRKCQLEVLYIS